MIGKSQQIRITDNVLSRFGEIPKYRSFGRERENAAHGKICGSLRKFVDKNAFAGIIGTHES